MSSPEIKDLFSNEFCQVEEENGIRTLQLYGDWNSETAAIAKKFHVNGLEFEVSSDWEDQSLDFLSEFPNLKSLSISGDSSLSWNRIETLSKLEDLSLWCDEGDEDPCSVNFSGLKHLRSCALAWKSSWASVLGVRSLRSLTVNDTVDLLVLDCSLLDSLEELRLQGCAALQNIALANPAKLRVLMVNGVEKLKPDWVRLGRDLESVDIIGKVGFKANELEHAHNLRSLHLDMGRVQSVDFLKKLPKLERVYIAGKLSDADNAVLREINARHQKA